MIGSRVKKRSGVTVYFIRFRDQHGRRVEEMVGASKREAEARLRARRVEVDRGKFTSKRAAKKAAEAEPTLKAFVADFMEKVASRTRSNHYRDRFRPLLAVADMQDRKLSTITRADLDAYVGNRAQEVTASTLRKDIIAMRKLFTMAVEWGKLDRSPAFGVKAPSEPKAEARYLSVEEVERLKLAAAPWLRPLISLALATGMRLKELTMLRWSDWDENAGVLHVAENTKTGTRTCPVGIAAKAILDGLRERQRNSVVLRKVPFIFASDAGADYTDEDTRRRISRDTSAAATKAGLGGATFHSLRHSAASLMVQAGVPLFEVGQILGHSTPTMTQRYSHLAPGHLKTAMAHLDAALGVAPAPGVVGKQVGRSKSKGTLKSVKAS